MGGSPGVVLLTTETPEIRPSRPDAVQPAGVWTLAVESAACGLWQSAQSLWRLLTPPNSSSVASVWPELAASASWR